MAIRYADRVRVFTATTGTGTINLGAAVTGFRTFASAVTNGQLATGATVYYVIEDAGNIWETGSGVYTAGSPDTLTRVVVQSSSGTTAITLTGAAQVYLAGTALSMVTAMITDGTIDGAAIGNTTPDTANFTALSSNSGVFSLSSSSYNYILYSQFGIGAPSYTARSVGTKLVLYPSIDASNADYAIGLDSATVWLSVPNSTGVFKFYFGTTVGVQLTSTGINASPIGTTTPSTGAFSTLSATLAITPSSTAGIIGTIAADNANAGAIGELISSTIATASAVSLVTATAKTITSITLSAGDWDVWGQITTKPAGTTTTSVFNFGINTTNNTLPTPSATAGGLTQMTIAVAAGFAVSYPVAQARINVSTTTIVYLVASVSFATSTMSAFGYIAARRAR